MNADYVHCMNNEYNILYNHRTDGTIVNNITIAVPHGFMCVQY